MPADRPGQRHRRFVATLVVLAAVVASAPLLTPPSAAAAGNLTDEAFFGVWDGSSWSTTGKIDYGYASGLAPVEHAVKAGDYAGAKAALLAYFGSRTNRRAPALTATDADRSIADLAVNETFPGPQADRLVGELTVGSTVGSVTQSVTRSVLTAAAGTRRVTYMLMGKHKETDPARFNSRENAAQPPRLKVTIDGTTYELAPDKDTYIVGGSSATFGSESSLLVNASGLPFDAGERRAYLSFDLSSLPSGSQPTSATLELYGASQGAADKALSVFDVSHSAWTEDTMSWTNTTGSIYSWQGAPGGTDWNAPPQSDVEYVNWLTRHYFLVPMAYEYRQEPSDTTYADHAIRLMRDFATDKAAGYNRSLEVGVRSVHWVKAHHHLRDAPSLTAADNTEILKFLWQQADYLSKPANFTSSNNWGVIQSNGLYHLAAYLPELSSAPSWLDTADTRLLTMANRLIKRDGSYVEGTTTYTAVVGALYLQTKEMATANEIPLPAALDERIHRLVTYLMDSSYPTGTDVMYGDSDETDNRPMVAKYGDLYGDAGFRYFGSGGAVGTPPAHTSALYPAGRVATMRTGWTTDGAYLHVNSQNFGGHGHPDLLHVNVFANGQRLLIDPGRNSYNADPVSDWLRKTTRAHNTVTIDGGAQVKSAPAHVTAWTSNDGFDYFEGLHRGYAGFAHTRGILFVKPEYWIVSDRIAAPAGTHEYEQNWHYLPTANPSLDPETKTASTAFGSGGNIKVVPSDPEQVTASMPSGYYAAGYGSAVPASYTSYARTATGDVAFDTVLYPTREGEERDVRVSRLETSPSVAPTVATALMISTRTSGAPNRGYYYLSHEATTAYAARRFAGFRFDGKLATIQTGAAGSLESALVARGTTLQRRGREDLIVARRPINDIAVSWSGRELEIEGSELVPSSDRSQAIKIYAPAARKVTLNGTLVPHVRAGDYVYAVDNSPASAIVKLPLFDAFGSSQHNASWRPTNLIDGDPGSSWSSSRQASGVGQQWAAVDAGGTVEIDRVTLIPRLENGVPLGFPEDFELQASTDGTTWTDIPGQSYTGHPNPADDDGVTFFFDSPVTARYVRLYATKFRTDGTSFYVQMAEMRLYRTDR